MSMYAKSDATRLLRGSQDGPAGVLYLDNTRSFGGAINSLINLLRGVDCRRFAPVLVTGQRKELLPDYLEDVHYERVDLKLPWTDRRTYERLRSLALFRPRVLARSLGLGSYLYWFLSVTLPEAVRYWRIGTRHRVRLVHLNNNVESQLAGILAAKLLGVPCVAHARSFQPVDWILRAHARLVDHHIAISSAIRDNLLELGVPPERITVVFDGIDLERFGCPGVERERLLRTLKVRADAKVFGIFGRIVEWKGIREFVLAAAAVVEADPSACALIVGDASDGGDKYYKEVVRLIADRGLEDKIVLAGYRTDVAALMDVMDVVAHASTEPEPFGMVLIEAMAAAKPVVATRGGGPLDIVLDGVTGLLVERGDPKGLTEAILGLLADPRRAADMGRAGKARAEAMFSDDRYATQVQHVYERLLDGDTRDHTVASTPHVGAANRTVMTGRR